MVIITCRLFIFINDTKVTIICKLNLGEYYYIFKSS